MNKLSVVIITLNEEARLPNLLDAVAWADEILVVDSGSTDGTLELCARYPNCRVIEQPFQGYGPQKRFAVAEATHDWVLSLDADELPDRALQAALRAAREQDPGGVAGFYLRRSLVFMGRAFTHGRESRERHLRLFDRRRGNFSGDAIHERVRVDGPTSELAGRLWHDSYRDLGDYFAKFNRYTSLSAVRMHQDGRRIGIPGILFRGPWTFFQYYLFHGNWLNGFPGFVWSVFGALYKTVRFLKLRELNLGTDTPGR
ncbi:MAG: glycosyltransferase family 2 protein [Gammaproteobacteria bacterium]